MELELPEPVTTGEQRTESVITEALSLREEILPANEPQADETKPAAAEPPTPVATQPKPAKTAPPASPPPPKTEKAKGPEFKGWYVQVGSFGQEMNANGLRERLKSAGYHARLQQVDIGKGYAYRVLVGPSNSRAAAEKLADGLKSGQQLSGMVIEYPYAAVLPAIIAATVAVLVKCPAGNLV